MSTLTQEFRRPFFGADDDLFHRCLAVSTAVGLVFLAVVLLTPLRQHVITRVDELPERFARLIVEKPKARALSPENRGLLEKPDTREELEKPAPEKRPEPVARPQARPRRIEAPPPVKPNAGTVGRDRAQKEVAAKLATTTAALEKNLESLSSSLKNSAPKTSRPSRSRRRPSVRSGRSGGQLGTIEAGLVGGAGSADLDHSTVEGSLVAIGSLEAGSPGSGAPAGGSGALGSGPGVYRSNESLLAVIQKYAAGIQYCYDNELKHDTSMSGKLVVSITVAASGDVVDASVVRNTVGSARLATCALSQIKDWKFPRIAGGATTFQAPFVFTPPR